MATLLGSPRITQVDVASRLGVDRSMVSRYRSGDRTLGIEDALYLVEHFGPPALEAAAAAVGLDLRIEDDPPAGSGGDALRVVRSALSAMAEEVSAQVAHAPLDRLPGLEARMELAQRLELVEQRCREARHALLSEPTPLQVAQ